MRNLDIADSRAKLEQYVGLGMVGTAHAELIGASAAHTDLVGDMTQGGAEAIASRGEVDADEELLDRAAMEVGTD
jgi:argininosuccinate synthase